MGCCVEKRAALRTPKPARPVPRAPEPDDEPGIAVEYRGDAPVLLRGRASGLVYTFSAARRVRLVSRLDARQLVRSPLFGRSRS